MLRKELAGALPCQVGALFVVAATFLAIKTVLRAGIDVDLDLRPFGPDGFDVAQWNAGVLLAEVQLRRHLRLVVGKSRDGAAVEADRGGQARQFCRRRVSHTAAETIA